MNAKTGQIKDSNVLQKAFSKTWEAAMRLKGSIVVNDAKLFL